MSSRLDEPGTLTGAAHPQTSHEAAARTLGRSGSARRRVMQALAQADRTDEELQAWLGMAANTQRPRRVELVELGYVAATGARRRTATGSDSIVWAATDAGREALAADGACAA